MNPILDFKGHVALATGASSGIRLATAKAFVVAGVAVTARSRNAPHSTIPGASR
jgi:NAD(P)-dependent dehydrogenase (short-subunit alcohol dehydrogenase family)